MASDKYDDIIRLAHHVSASRPQMPVSERAAQFSPFAALTGYEATIRETGRLTEERIDLDEDMAAEVNEKLQMVQERIEEQPEVSITYFLPDQKKAGGAYITVTGRIRKIDQYKGTVNMHDGTNVPIREIKEICLFS
ncbi:MAG: YolD-like family protein [Lachnospiraceae bacterium]|nr:YolD-like family protein [Lachnospiraceae bacterium]